MSPRNGNCGTTLQYYHAPVPRKLKHICDQFPQIGLSTCVILWPLSQFLVNSTEDRECVVLQYLRPISWYWVVRCGQFVWYWEDNGWLAGWLVRSIWVDFEESPTIILLLLSDLHPEQVRHVCLDNITSRQNPIVTRFAKNPLYLLWPELPDKERLLCQWHPSLFEALGWVGSLYRLLLDFSTTR